MTESVQGRDRALQEMTIRAVRGMLLGVLAWLLSTLLVRALLLGAMVSRTTSFTPSSRRRSAIFTL